MRELSPAWETDLAVLRLTGSRIEENADHLIIRSPDNPQFHWGNCLFVTDEQAVDDAKRWSDVFHDAFPAATWVAIGLVQMPADLAAWTDLDLHPELDDVLTTRTLPLQTRLPEGYTARALTGSDWEQSVRWNLSENERSGEYDTATHEPFIRAQMHSRRALCERGDAAFFGAFADDHTGVFRDGRLVAELGIVRCGSTARYQSVQTDLDHRRRGLASSLLGLAARWASERGCDRWVIVTEATNPAGLLYRSLGFTPDVPAARAYYYPRADADFNHQ